MVVNVEGNTLNSETLDASKHWLTATQFKQSLNELQPFIGNYGWLWTILRWRASLHGGMFPERAYNALKRFGNPNKPYFIGIRKHL